MATADPVQPGKSIPFTAASDVAAGEIMVRPNGGIMIAETDVLSGMGGTASITGVWSMPKPISGLALSAGALAGFNATSGVLSILSGADAYAGRIWNEGTTDGTDFVSVEINAPALPST